MRGSLFFLGAVLIVLSVSPYGVVADEGDPMRIGPYVVYRDYSFGSPEMTVFDLYKHDWQFTGYYNGDVACDDGDACGGTRTWNYFGVYHENLPDVGLDELAKCIEEEVAAADPNFPLALVAGLKACVDELG